MKDPKSSGAADHCNLRPVGIEPTNNHSCALPTQPNRFRCPNLTDKRTKPGVHSFHETANDGDVSQSWEWLLPTSGGEREGPSLPEVQFYLLRTLQHPFAEKGRWYVLSFSSKRSRTKPVRFWECMVRSFTYTALWLLTWGSIQCCWRE